MSIQVTTAQVQQYKNAIMTLLQQRGGKLIDKVMTDTFMGKAAKAVEQIGAVKPVKNQSRHSDTPLISTPHDARWIYPNDYDWADLIDDQDKLRLLIDPSSSYVQNGVMAMRRAQDDEILQCFFRAAQTGENGTTSTAFPAGQIVAANVGATGNVGLNVAKLRAAKKLMIQNGVDIENDELYVAVNAVDHDNMLNEAQAISLDYNTRPVLVDGKISAFMGFNFVPIEFTDSASYDAGVTLGVSPHLTPCWARSGVKFGLWNDVTVRVSERDDKRYSTQVYVTGTFGATRLEEKRVVQILNV